MALLCPSTQSLDSLHFHISTQQSDLCSNGFFGGIYLEDIGLYHHMVYLIQCIGVRAFNFYLSSIMTFNIGNTYIISLHTVWNITIKSIFVHGYQYIIAYMVTTNSVRMNFCQPI